MSNPFRFKRFTIIQERSSMKVGTDGVLLGAWSGVSHNPKRILDIGTGTGLLALMLAQRTEHTGAKIHAVEIDPESAAEAMENIENSPWPDRIKIYTEPIQDFAASVDIRYDLIVSNPPFFSDSLLSPVAGRTTARHTTSLTYEELISSAERLLSPEARFAVIIPSDRNDEFINMASDHGLMPVRITSVWPTMQSQPKRTLLEFIKGRRLSIVEEKTLVIESDGRHGYSPEYINLTSDFYLKFQVELSGIAKKS